MGNSCCIGGGGHGRQSSVTAWEDNGINDSAGEGGREDAGGAHLAFGRFKKGSQEQIDDGSDFGLGKKLELSLRQLRLGCGGQVD
jgi:hypothetical protein